MPSIRMDPNENLSNRMGTSRPRLRGLVRRWRPAIPDAGFELVRDRLIVPGKRPGGRGAPSRWSSLSLTGQPSASGRLGCGGDVAFGGCGIVLPPPFTLFHITSFRRGAVSAAARCEFMSVAASTVLATD